MSTQDFPAFLERLSRSQAPVNQNLSEAIVLVMAGFRSCKDNSNGPTNEEALETAASQVANACLCDERALECVQKFVLEDPKDLFAYMHLMVTKGVPYTCFSNQILQIAALQIAGHITPASCIAQYTVLLEQMVAAGNLQSCDQAQILMNVSQCYASLGEEAKTIEHLKNAAAISKGTLVGDNALYMLCKTAGQGTVESLNYLKQEIHKENPKYSEVCSMLVGALNNISEEDDDKDKQKDGTRTAARKKEIKKIKKSQHHSIELVKQIYGPFLQHFQEHEHNVPLFFKQEHASVNGVATDVNDVATTTTTTTTDKKTTTNNNDHETKHSESKQQTIVYTKKEKNKRFQDLTKIIKTYLLKDPEKQFQDGINYYIKHNKLNPFFIRFAQQKNNDELNWAHEIEECIKEHARQTIAQTASTNGRTSLPTNKYDFDCCATCGKSSNKKKNIVLKQCSKCGTVQYCSQQCQMVDWKQRNHKTKCKQVRTIFPCPMDIVNIVGRYRKYINNALNNEDFIQWWSIHLNEKERKDVCRAVMEDMPNNEKDDEIWREDCGSTFKNMFPELTIASVCSFDCDCGQCDLHGDCSARLLSWMHMRARCPVEAMDADRRLAASLYGDALNALNTTGVDMDFMVKGKEESVLHVLVGFVEQWMVSKPETAAAAAPNLTLRAVGCARCGKDAFGDAYIGTTKVKGEIQEEMETYACQGCNTIFWCSMECRQRGTFLHNKICLCEGTKHHLSRRTCIDYTMAVAEYEYE